MKLLWLVSWYPEAISPFNGDFIQRHAEAVSMFHDVQVIYVLRDKKGIQTRGIRVENNVKGRLSETIIYYFVPSYPFPFFGKLTSARKFNKLMKQAVLDYINKEGNPSLVHIHVGMKAGLIAGWIREKLGIPYVVSEHWTGFLREAQERFDELPIFYRSIWHKTIKHAKAVSAVSHYLLEALKQQFGQINGKVIPNVVNTKLFHPSSEEPVPMKLIHISNLQEFKNPQQILQALARVKKTHPDVKLEMIGSTRKDIVQVSQSLGLANNVSFHPEMPQSVLAKHLNNSKALILYSKYETFGCVIIEANACAVPVIVSDIPVFHEIVKEGENGFFVSTDNPEALAQKIIQVLDHAHPDKNKIAASTSSKFGYESVGKQFSDWYRELTQGS